VIKATLKLGWKVFCNPRGDPPGAFYCGRRPSLFKSGHDLSTSVHEAFE
jgi:hypothetical protein